MRNGMRYKMKLKTTTFEKDTKTAKIVREIYESNFPDYERTPWGDLFVGKFVKTTKVAYLLDSKVVGMCIYYKENDLIYLIWLVVDKALQGQGIGSKILQTLHQENKNCGIALNIENPNDAKCKDKDVRVRREKFYVKNGFIHSGIVFDCFNEEWTPVCLGNVDLEKYMKIEAAFFPDTHNVRKIN